MGQEAQQSKACVRRSVFVGRCHSDLHAKILKDPAEKVCLAKITARASLPVFLPRMGLKALGDRHHAAHGPLGIAILAQGFGKVAAMIIRKAVDYIEPDPTMM